MFQEGLWMFQGVTLEGKGESQDRSQEAFTVPNQQLMAVRPRDRWGAVEKWVNVESTLKSQTTGFVSESDVRCQCNREVNDDSKLEKKCNTIPNQSDGKKVW